MKTLALVGGGLVGLALLAQRKQDQIVREAREALNTVPADYTSKQLVGYAAPAYITPEQRAQLERAIGERAGIPSAGVALGAGAALLVLALRRRRR